MPPRPTQAQRDAAADSLKWESAFAYVRACQDLNKAIKEYGVMSPEAGAALKVCDRTKRAYNKVRTK